jgi:hypothetical protein
MKFVFYFGLGSISKQPAPRGTLCTLTFADISGAIAAVDALDDTVSIPDEYHDTRCNLIIALRVNRVGNFRSASECEIFFEESV